MSTVQTPYLGLLFTKLLSVCVYVWVCVCVFVCVFVYVCVQKTCVCLMTNSRTINVVRLYLPVIALFLLITIDVKQDNIVYVLVGATTHSGIMERGLNTRSLDLIAQGLRMNHKEPTRLNRSILNESVGLFQFYFL